MLSKRMVDAGRIELPTSALRRGSRRVAARTTVLHDDTKHPVSIDYSVYCCATLGHAGSWPCNEFAPLMHPHLGGAQGNVEDAPLSCVVALADDARWRAVPRVLQT